MHTPPLQVASAFDSTYLCESAFSDLSFTENNLCLTESHLEDSIRVAVSGYTTDSIELN